MPSRLRQRALDLAEGLIRTPGSTRPDGQGAEREAGHIILGALCASGLPKGQKVTLLLVCCMCVEHLHLCGHCLVPERLPHAGMLKHPTFAKSTLRSWTLQLRGAPPAAAVMQPLQYVFKQEGPTGYHCSVLVSHANLHCCREDMCWSCGPWRSARTARRSWTSTGLWSNPRRPGTLRWRLRCGGAPLPSRPCRCALKCISGLVCEGSSLSRM